MVEEVTLHDAFAIQICISLTYCHQVGKYLGYWPGFQSNSSTMPYTERICKNKNIAFSQPDKLNATKATSYACNQKAS